MKSSTRIILNTSIQYIRAVISAIIILLVARLILNALGAEDYGIYSLVAGIVSMLTFIQNSLIVTTQRFLSFYQGEGNKEMQRKVMNNSVVTLSVTSFILIIFLIFVQPFLFDGFLNIPTDRVEAAIWVYYCMLGSLFFTMISVPYYAVLIAHENIVFVTIVLLLNAFLQIPIAFLLYSVPYDRLKLYSTALMFIPFLNFFIYFSYTKKRYDEVRKINIFSFDKTVFYNMFSFMGWSLYSTGCILIRTQGIAILLNRFFGSVVNAAYGISLQVSSQLAILPLAIQNAVKPQLVKAEGIGDRERMFRLAEIMSKFSFLLLSAISIPIIIKMDILLSMWLKNVPENTVLFCRCIVLMNLIDQLTIGLGSANEAIGNIRNYSLIVNSLKIITIPIALLGLLFFQNSVEVVMFSMLIIELLCAITRLVVLKIIGGLSIVNFIRKVFLKELFPFIIACIVGFVISLLFNSFWSLVLTFLLTVLVLFLTAYKYALCNDEKHVIDRVLRSAVIKVKNMF